eukprot:gnl/TRDRNA2_/TRDRNA2_136294_c0_seq1.p1 gnl/TRDRNA2_/TRDRNA2_136294_c0~~gnl/TRDRNA2_/TRDRNA2_136294_c0_seq1.p1  ORF type:complete len:612 (-),score=106.97 gnl/TRDRNA2_/TRDRNA2_136294_c0_seq1:85-1650(-)
MGGAEQLEFPAWQRRQHAWETECSRLRLEHEERLRQWHKERQRKSTADAHTGHGAADADEADGAPTLVLPAVPAPLVLAEHGCYLWGDVGRGKTLLMDLFALSVDSSSSTLSRAADEPLERVPAVNRVHFHQFMHGVHRQLHAPRAGMRRSSREGLSEIVAKVARNGCPAALCFDEFQVTNIADAALLTQIFGELFAQDAVVVATSNRPPEGLYQGGLRREAHMPEFLAALEGRLRVHHLEGLTDYREQRAQVDKTSPAAEEDFLVVGSSPGGLPAASARAALEDAFAAAVATSGAGEASPRTLPVAWGRRMQCELAGGGAVRFSFDQICGSPLSAEDYLAIILEGGVHTFVVSDVPKFGLDEHNEARRFTNLVDCLYDQQCRLVCTADAPAHELLQDVELLSTVELLGQPGMGIAGSEKSLRKHGDVSFTVGPNSPCRPDTFATAEADAEAGTSGLRVSLSAAPGADLSAADEGIAGVMEAASDSLRESGFAAKRCVSRLHEMNTKAYKDAHDARWGVAR